MGHISNKEGGLSPKIRARYRRGLVGIWNSSIRIPRWPTPILEPKPHENIRNVSHHETHHPNHSKGLTLDPQQRIVEGNVRYPHSMSPDARDLISGLCTVNPSQRLGNIAGGTERVKAHPFFANLDWEALYYRKMKGPIIPELRHAADTSCFDEYDPPPERHSVYGHDMAHKWDDSFKDF